MKIDLTIVTVSYNAEKTISETLSSIRAAKGLVDFEYVVIDGNSKDRTLEIFRANNDIIDVLVSEPDSGLYHAMNKGAKKATRSYVLFINADDLLSAEGLLAIAQDINSLAYDYVCCSVSIASEAGEPIGHREPGIKHGQHKYLGMPVPHQGLIVKKTANQGADFFDTTYRIRADYDHLQKLINSSQKFLVSKVRLAVFRMGGASSSSKAKNEKLAIDVKHHGAFWAYLFLGYTNASLVAQKLLPKSIIFIIKKLKKSPLHYSSILMLGACLT